MSEFEETDFDFEEKLKRELQRVDAPAGFADRVMERVGVEAAEERRGRLVVMPRRWFSVAVAAMLLVGIVLGGWQWQQRRQERQEAEIARRQFEVAMQVTGRTLVGVQERIGRAGRKREVE